MAIDQFLHIDGIKGEHGRKDWIEVLVYTPQKPGAPAPQTDLKDFRAERDCDHQKVDASSPLLQEILHKRQTHPQVKEARCCALRVKPGKLRCLTLVVANVNTSSTVRTIKRQTCRRRASLSPMERFSGLMPGGNGMGMGARRGRAICEDFCGCRMEDEDYCFTLRI